MTRSPRSSTPIDAPRGSGITDAEWQVMEALWEDSPATSREVADRLTADTGWSAKTVKTLLGRLVSKGALGYRQDGNRYLYSPEVSRGEAVRAEGRSFVARIFGGDAASALLHFARQTELSADDVEALERVLRERDARDAEEGS